MKNEAFSFYFFYFLEVFMQVEYMFAYKLCMEFLVFSFLNVPIVIFQNLLLSNTKTKTLMGILKNPLTTL
jgi:hypothetical protein